MDLLFGIIESLFLGMSAVNHLFGILKGLFSRNVCSESPIFASLKGLFSRNVCSESPMLASLKGHVLRNVCSEAPLFASLKGHFYGMSAVNPLFCIFEGPWLNECLQ